MAVYTYSRVPAFNPNTSPVSVAKSATGSVYDIGDTGFLTALTLTLVATNTASTTLVSDANGMFPDFTLVDRTQCVFKSGTMVFVLTTTTPIPGPTGAASTVAGPAGPATTDASLLAAGTVADARLPARLQDTALGAAYSPLNVGGKKAVRQDALVINVKDYGAVGDGATDDSVSVLNAVAAIPSNMVGTVYFPPTATFYKMTSPLPNRNGITYRMDNRGTGRVQWAAGSMLAPTGDLSDVIFQDIYLESGSASPLIDLGATGGLFHCLFSRVRIVMYNTAAQIIRQNGTGSFLENKFEFFDLYRQAGHTVPAFDIVNSSGSVNSNVFQHGRANSNNCTSTPFWRIENTATSGAFANDNVWYNITGEQNRGGLIHLYSTLGSRITDAVDWDAAGAYMDHLIKLDKSSVAGTLAPRRNMFDNIGTRGGTLSAGVKQLYTANDTETRVGFVGGGSGTDIPVIQTTTLSAIWSAAGYSRPFLTATANYTAQVYDGMIIANGAAVTVTLPDPATMIPGREYRVKNINAAAATVNSAGTSKTLDGASSQSLAQWGKATYVSDGTQWLTV